MNPDMHTARCTSALDWTEMHIQGNAVPELSALPAPPLALRIVFVFFFYRKLIVVLEAIRAVFEYLCLSEPAKSSGTKPREASPSLFPLLSPGRTLL